MAYRVVLTEDAEADLDGFIKYLLFEKESGQTLYGAKNQPLVILLFPKQRLLFFGIGKTSGTQK